MDYVTVADSVPYPISPTTFNFNINFKFAINFNISTNFNLIKSIGGNVYVRWKYVWNGYEISTSR